MVSEWEPMCVFVLRTGTLWRVRSLMSFRGCYRTLWFGTVVFGLPRVRRLSSSLRPSLANQQSVWMHTQSQFCIKHKNMLFGCKPNDTKTCCVVPSRSQSPSRTMVGHPPPSLQRGRAQELRCQRTSSVTTNRWTKRRRRRKRRKQCPLRSVRSVTELHCEFRVHLSW